MFLCHLSVFAGKVQDEHKVEKAFHNAFGPYRVNTKREFFKIEPEQAIALLELLIVEDVTLHIGHFRKENCLISMMKRISKIKG